MQREKWMNLPEEYCGSESKFVVLPISYEKDVTYGKGASLGPSEIIKASQHLEYYDDEFDCEPFLQGIQLADELKLSEKTPEEMVASIKEEVVRIGEKKFIIGLGGDHAITNGVVAGLEEVYGDDFSIIQFDAHSDFRDSWNGSSLNHACVAKQISKKHEIALVGIRSMDVDEAREIKERNDVHLIKSYDFSLEKVKEILPHLKKNVFITIDVDVFDPSFLRNTGTPEPDGLTWRNIIDCLKLIFEKKNVIGADVVEFAPTVNFDAEAYALAKLVYKIIALQK